MSVPMALKTADLKLDHSSNVDDLVTSLEKPPIIKLEQAATSEVEQKYDKSDSPML
jgi:hypothetical protein